jgi:group II intron reverse transcriptase/maturase
MRRVESATPATERPRPLRGLGNAVLALQCGLATAATRSPHKRFHRLYRLLGEREWLEAATKAVLDNSGAETPGIDGMRGSLLREPSIRAGILEDLRKELHEGYRPSPVLRKYIPKASGGQRPLGIPTIKDRIVQMTLKMCLEPIFEADFLPNSNGFRPGRSTLECVLPTYQYGNRICRYDWTIEGDIKGCFDNIDHRTLMEVIRRRIADRRVLRLIWRYLRAPVVERDKRTKTVKGTPQGGVLSPLLANIYLNKFDQYWFARWGRLTRSQRSQERAKGHASCVLFRYADDFILLVKGTRNGAVNIVHDTRQFFAKRLKLELTQEKTRVTSLEDGFDFLGFRVQRKRMGHFSCVRVRPTYRNVVRLVVKLQKMLGKQADADDPAMKITALNRVLRGWANYYRTVNARYWFLFGDYVTDQLYRSWYARKRHMNVKDTLMETRENGRIVHIRDNTRQELFKMSSLPSMRISMNRSAMFRYRHIENPYLTGNHVTCIEEEEQPLIDAQEVHPLAQEYDEIYLLNRVKVFERDGWRCTECPERMGLVAHHIEPVPVGKVFDPEWVHRVENLQTLCARCHRLKRRCRAS